MNHLSSFKTPSVRGPTRNAQRHRVVILAALLLALTIHDLCAQGGVGNNNPSGVSGIFNGQVQTGCSYDPWTGNATRSVTDIVVAGAVGEYPLALVRTANSRTPSTTEVFGWSGGWNHNYNWILADSPTSSNPNFYPTRYTVDFPDGRVETFQSVTWDSDYRVRPGADTPPQSSSAGVRERFVPLTLSTMLADLILPDGGKIEFTASRHVTTGGLYYYKYAATAIYDPHGLKTTLQWEVVGTNNLWRLAWVIEPAGRNLHFIYATPTGPLIAHVTASDGRTVYYYYIYCNGCTLSQVVYYNWTASYQYCASNIPGDNLPLLLRTADDPMYPGPMKRIAYDYQTGNNPDGTAPVYGQILRERYWDGQSGDEDSGAVVSTLTVGAAPSNHNIRTETRGDAKTRTFTYTTSGYLTSDTDFMSHSAWQGYDTYKYINYVTDRNGHRTDFTSDPITGNVTQIQYPLTQEDTTNQTVRPTVNFTYVNNYYLASFQAENGQYTNFTPDVNNRITRIDYPDGGYETFSYDASHFYQLQSHRMTTGGSETFTYDSGGLLQTYRNPDTVTGNPTARYRYDNYDRVSDVTDVFGAVSNPPNPPDSYHTTSYSYNLRNEMLTTTSPMLYYYGNWNRHTLVINTYNPDGTLASTQDALGHLTTYNYDDYRRLRSTTPPVRGGGDNGVYTTYFYYDTNGTGDDYRLTDSNVTWAVLPSGKKINTTYYDDRRKQFVIVGYGTSDSATTTYHYDNVGNVTQVINPLNPNFYASYDERNRPYSLSVGGHTTTLTFDTYGRKKTITRPNQQLITNINFDNMNRVLVQTATNVSSGNNTYSMVSQYSYYTPSDGANAPVGLLKTFVDPHLYNSNPPDMYTYSYDSMGRKHNIQYPAESGGIHRADYFYYDIAGRLYQYATRASKTQTFYYDAINRMTSFTWNDATPSVSFTYDLASDLIEVDNANAHISRTYYNDNLLRTETQDGTPGGGLVRTINYTYDADGNRASLQIPGYSFNYDYTGRNQLKDIINNADNTTPASYVYDLNGNVTSRTLGNSTHSAYTPDSYGRPSWVQHFLNSGTRTVEYGYDDTNNSNNRLWALRLINAQSPEDHKGEAFSYDLADQAIAGQLDVSNPNQASQPLPQTVIYDASGNRSWFTNIQYATDNLSQYTSIGGNSLTYRADANLFQYINNTTNPTYAYDAQNRLTIATVGGVTMTFQYDGLNRQVSRTVGSTTTYSTWDGWDLVEDYHSNGSVDATYLYGTTGLVTDMRSNRYYYQDGSGSTSHVADASGNLLEWYRYDLQGTPIFYDAGDNQLKASNYSVRHLFTGQQWYRELGLYDMRNRFYSPDIGRFLQPDPIGFLGDRTNLYRYARNNPVRWSDPWGLVDPSNTKKVDPDGSDLGGQEYGYGPDNGPATIVDTHGFEDQGVGAGTIIGAPPGEGNGVPGGSGSDVNGGNTPGGNGLGQGETGGDGPGGGGGPGGGPGWGPGVFGTGDFSLVGEPGTGPGRRVNKSFYGPHWDPFFRFLNTPPSAATAAFTDKGRIPTLIAAGILSFGVALPETGLYAGAAAYNAAIAAYNSAQYYGAVGVGYALTNPQGTADFGIGVSNIPSDTFAPTSTAGVYGWLAHYLNPWAYPDN